MKAIHRLYHIPIAIALLTVIGLSVWSWSRWQDILERRRERSVRHTTGALDTLVSTIDAFGQKGNLSRSDVETVMRDIIRHSPFRFVIAQHNGVRILEVGNAPKTLSLPSDEGYRFDQEGILFWKKVQVHFPLDMEAMRKANPDSKDSEVALSKRNAVMVIRANIGPRPSDLSRPIRNMAITLAVAILFVAAALVAWIMTIRGGLLTEQLRIERERRAYLEELGLAAAGLAHETKNPLGIILGMAQQIVRNPDEPQQSRDMVEHIIDEVDKATARLGDFMTYARQRKPDIKPLEARRALNEIADILRTDFDAAGVKLALDCRNAKILADGGMLKQILVNLLLNALKASDSGDLVTVRMESNEGVACLTVEDHGIGIQPEVLPNVFKPYVAGNADGHGLGLAIVKRFANENGWEVEISSEPGRGTRVSISGIKLTDGEDPQA